MNYSQMIDFEHEYRKVFLLPPQELEFLLSDLRGVSMTLPELAQVLLDGGFEPEYLGEKYKTSKGRLPLLMVIACQDSLVVDYADLVRRHEQYYAGLKMALETYAASLPMKEEPLIAETIEPPSTSNEEDTESVSSVETEDDEVLTFSAKAESGGAVAYQYEDKHGTHDGLVSSIASWDPDASINWNIEQTPTRWCARVMHAGWSSAEPTDLTAHEYGSEVDDLPIPWDRGRRRPVRGGFTPKLWLQVVRKSFPKGCELPNDTLDLVKSIEPDYDRAAGAKPGPSTSNFTYVEEEESPPK